MGKMHEVEINGYSIFFEELEDARKPSETHDASRRKRSNEPMIWDATMLEKAAQPLVDILGVLHRTTQSMAPDELELSMQLELAVSGNTPVFKVLSAESKCQLAAKFVWKRSCEN